MAESPQASEEQKEYQYTNGCVYNGAWRANRRHGVGNFTWPSGAHYEGHYESDRRKGAGSIWYADKSVYIGEWLND